MVVSVFLFIIAILPSLFNAKTSRFLFLFLYGIVNSNEKALFEFYMQHPIHVNFKQPKENFAIA